MKIHDLCAHTFKPDCPECDRVSRDPRLPRINQQASEEMGTKFDDWHWPYCWKFSKETQRDIRALCKRTK